jgi:hypothetical protein
MRCNIKRGIEEGRRGWEELDLSFFPPLRLSFLFGGVREKRKKS